MSLKTEYFDTLHEYKMKYGNKTFLLMQVGSFYEVYGLEDELDDINEYGNICNLMVVKKKDL